MGKVPAAKRQRRYSHQPAGTCSGAKSVFLVGAIEESSVFLYGPAQGESIVVLPDDRPRRCEKTAGVELVVVDNVERVAMECIGAGFHREVR